VPSSPKDEQITPNGRFFVFVSQNVLGSSGDNPNEYDEIYRYDNETASLACVSCPPHNALAKGGSILGGISLFTWDETPPENTVSENGSYVFFQSNDELVPQDVNGTGGNPGASSFLDPWTDVYEWHNGVISLISSGTDSQPSILAGASADGSNVFFMTHSQLVPQDNDTSADIYDARIDGGFPSPAEESAACLGDTCLSPPVSLNDPTPASTAFVGPGSPAPLATMTKTKSKQKPCPKRTVRRQGRCVKRETGRARRATRRVGGYNRGGAR
jgi:hypothetical protein